MTRRKLVTQESGNQVQFLPRTWLVRHMTLLSMLHVQTSGTYVYASCNMCSASWAFQFLITCTMKISGRYLVTLRAMCVTSEGRHTGAVPGMFFFMFVPILCFRLPKDWCCLGNAPGPHFQPLGQKMQETSSRSLVGAAPYVCAPDVTPDQSSQASIFTYSNPRLKAREQLMHSLVSSFHGYTVGQPANVPPVPVPNVTASTLPSEEEDIIHTRCQDGVKWPCFLRLQNKISLVASLKSRHSCGFGPQSEARLWGSPVPSQTQIMVLNSHKMELKSVSKACIQSSVQGCSEFQHTLRHTNSTGPKCFSRTTLHIYLLMSLLSDSRQSPHELSLTGHSSGCVRQMSLGTFNRGYTGQLGSTNLSVSISRGR